MTQGRVGVSPAMTVRTTGTGTSLIVKDGTTTVNPTTTIKFTSGMTVTDAGGGEADVVPTASGSSIVYARGKLSTDFHIPSDTASLVSFAGMTVLEDTHSVIDVANSWIRTSSAGIWQVIFNYRIPQTSITGSGLLEMYVQTSSSELDEIGAQEGTPLTNAQGQAGFVIVGPRRFGSGATIQLGGVTGVGLAVDVEIWTVSAVKLGT